VSSLAHVVQLPKTFCGNEGVLECSGLTELWMGIERVDGKIQSGVKPPQSKKPGSGLNFLKMITLASSREIPSPTALRPTPPSDFKFQVSAFPQPPSPRLSTPVSRLNRPISVIFQLRDLEDDPPWIFNESLDWRAQQPPFFPRYCA
jgi:hypothetical protein